MDTPPASPVLDSPVPSLPISPARTKTRGVLQPTVAPLKSNPPSYRTLSSRLQLLWGTNALHPTVKPALTQQDSKLLLSQDPFAFSRLLKSYQDGAILVRSRDAYAQVVCTFPYPSLFTDVSGS